jgi:hypothetical protein
MMHSNSPCLVTIQVSSRKAEQTQLHAVCWTAQGVLHVLSQLMPQLLRQQQNACHASADDAHFWLPACLQAAYHSVLAGLSKPQLSWKRQNWCKSSARLHTL